MSNHSLTRSQVLLIAVIFEGGLGLVAWILGALLPRPPLAQIRYSAIDLGLAVLASLPLIVGLVLLTRYPVGPLRQLKSLVQELLVPLFRNCTLLDFIVIAVLAGLGEEMLFRGVVQEAIGQRFGAIMGVLSASVLFGLAHSITQTYAMVAGLIGLYLGLLLFWTDNLLVPIVTHALYDLFALGYLLRFEKPDGTPSGP